MMLRYVSGRASSLLRRGSFSGPGSGSLRLVGMVSASTCTRWMGAPSTRLFSTSAVGDERGTEEYMSVPLGDSDVPQSAFSGLGLLPDIVKGLQSRTLVDPTPVQRATVPRILSGENLVMSASTGSGKTLAYMLPIIQSLATQEGSGYVRASMRPRVVVLVPTRELARQVLQEVKSISHFCKVSSTAVLGGER